MHTGSQSVTYMQNIQGTVNTVQFVVPAIQIMNTVLTDPVQPAVIGQLLNQISPNIPLNSLKSHLSGKNQAKTEIKAHNFYEYSKFKTI